MAEADIHNKYGRRGSTLYSRSQLDVRAARRTISNLVGLPNSHQALDRWARETRDGHRHKSLNAVKQKKLIEDTEKTWHVFEKHKQMEAELMQWDYVDGLRYVVAEGSDTRTGQFHVRVKGSGTVIHVCRDWVVRNFERDVWQSVVNNYTSSFVNVYADVKISFDSRQIQKLRYVRPETGVRNKDAYYQGIVADGTYVDLPKDFVETNFPDKYLHRVHEVSLIKDSHKFVHIPPGAPRTMEGNIMLDERYPRLEYMQEGHTTCLFSSFASALCFLGLTDTARKISEAARAFSMDSAQGINNWNGLLQLMAKECKWLQPVKIHGKVFDVMKDISQFPTVMSLEAVDGGTQHAITVVGCMIFDSNCERALALTKRNLDYCCSTDDLPGNYKRVHKGYRFKENPSKRGWLDSFIQQKGIDLFMHVDGDEETDSD